MSHDLHGDAATTVDPSRRRLLGVAATGVVALPVASVLAGTARTPAPATPAAARRQDGRGDFDFYIGRWQVRNERLKQRWVGSDDWDVFDATDECRPILGGLGTIDEYVTDHYGERLIGNTLRLFDPKTRQWSAYWVSNRSGVLEPPVIGRFKDGIGTFVGKDVDAGVPILVRYLWTEITPTSAKWDQAYSRDDGKSWETNWIMRMTRID
ncbi:hypothetical protein IP90_03083 [Luteimonas cucumeris]|uniref:DUF1579 domain-containing protein n=1 Tax=Luteimonas cucumeris TaxID=985012 RepID=A0A562KVL4_9GAMM|nr:hypothetical protein [Luteimonas cucumeris]TWH99468.1 hypothetical protein IP90_03083 [Luteimonas cucumeris]